MLGAVLYKGLKHVLLDPLPAGSTGPFIVGTIASAAVGLVAIDLLLGYVRRHSYLPFVIYRLVLAALIRDHRERLARLDVLEDGGARRREAERATIAEPSGSGFDARRNRGRLAGRDPEQAARHELDSEPSYETSTPCSRPRAENQPVTPPSETPPAERLLNRELSWLAYASGCSRSLPTPISRSSSASSSAGSSRRTSTSSSRFALPASSIRSRPA